MTVEQEIAKLVPDWIEEFDKMFDGHEMDEEYKLNLIDSYRDCVVGDIRKKVGLSRSYTGEHDKERCMHCAGIARYLANLKKRESFEQVLRSLKKHLENDHKVKLEAVNS